MAALHNKACHSLLSDEFSSHRRQASSMPSVSEPKATLTGDRDAERCLAEGMAGPYRGRRWLFRRQISERTAWPPFVVLASPQSNVLAREYSSFWLQRVCAGRSIACAGDQDERLIAPVAPELWPGSIPSPNPIWSGPPASCCLSLSAGRFASPRLRQRIQELDDYRSF